jgi:hypothetical protein
VPPVQHDFAFAARQVHTSWQQSAGLFQRAALELASAATPEPPSASSASKGSSTQASARNARLIALSWSDAGSRRNAVSAVSWGDCTSGC